MANFGKAFGDPARKYAVDIAIEQITGNPILSSYSNAHMDRGHEQEPIARALYEQETFCEVTNGGFFCNDIFGDSPDGLVLHDGVIEIKCVIASVHFANIKRESFDPAYKWQFVGHLLPGRLWLDTISCCLDYPEGNQLYVYRIERDAFEKEFEMVRERVEEFLELIKETKYTILNSDYFIQGK